MHSASSFAASYWERLQGRPANGTGLQQAGGKIKPEYYCGEFKGAVDVRNAALVRSDCVCYASERMNELSFLSYELSLIARSAGSVASVFMDGVLHRETRNWNHKLNDITFLDSFIDPQTRPSRKQLGG